MPNGVVKTERQQAAEEKVEDFRRALGPFVVAAETTRMPMMFTDANAPGHPIVFVNQAFLNLTGYQEHEVLGHDFNFLMERGTDPEMLAEIRTAFDGGRDLTPLVRYRCREGGCVWVSILITPVRTEYGDVVQHFASFIDMTQHKKGEDRLRSVLDGLNERTRATLSAILAIRDATFGGMTEDDIAALQGSIWVLLKAQGVLEDAGDRVGLSGLISQVLSLAGVDERLAPRVRVKGDEAQISPGTSIVLAVLLQELACNAIRHGSLSNDIGNVDISWHTYSIDDAHRLQLRWQEGEGAVTPAGYATRLIEQGLAQQLNADVHLDHLPTGLICQMTMPWDGPHNFRRGG